MGKERFGHKIKPVALFEYLKTNLKKEAVYSHRLSIKQEEIKILHLWITNY